MSGMTPDLEVPALAGEIPSVLEKLEATLRELKGYRIWHGLASILLAELALAAVMHRARQYVAADRRMDGLDRACAGWLAEAQEDVQRRIDFGNFEP